MSKETELAALIVAVHEARLKLQWEIERSRSLVASNRALNNRVQLVEARIAAKLVNRRSDPTAH